MLSSDLIDAAADGDLAEVQRLLTTGADPKVDDSWPLQAAAANGRLDVVKFLLPLSEPKANDSWALRLAAHYGHLEVVKLLLPQTDPYAKGSAALRAAAENGHSDVVKLLLPLSCPNEVLSDELFLESDGADMLVSCLPMLQAHAFVTAHQNLDMSRTRAMLGVARLQNRPLLATHPLTTRHRS